MLTSTLIIAICALLTLTSTAQLVIPDLTSLISNAIKSEKSTNPLPQPDTLTKPFATETAYRSSNLAIFALSESSRVSRLKRHHRKIPQGKVIRKQHLVLIPYYTSQCIDDLPYSSNLQIPIVTKD